MLKREPIIDKYSILPILFVLLIFINAHTCFAMKSVAGVNASGGRNRSLSVDPTGSVEGYSAVLYNNTNGLPTSEANAIAETKEGFIWIGSYGGLIRYDGHSFVRLIPAIRAAGRFSDSVRRQSSMGHPDGRNGRRTALRVRRRNDPSSSELAFGRHEPWQRFRLNDHRPGHKNHKSRRIEDRLRTQTVLSLHRIRCCLLVPLGSGGQSHFGMTLRLYQNIPGMK